MKEFIHTVFDKLEGKSSSQIYIDRAKRRAAEARDRQRRNAQKFTKGKGNRAIGPIVGAALAVVGVGAAAYGVSQTDFYKDLVGPKPILATPMPTRDPNYGLVPTAERSSPTSTPTPKAPEIVIVKSGVMGDESKMRVGGVDGIPISLDVEGGVYEFTDAQKFEMAKARQEAIDKKEPVISLRLAGTEKKGGVEVAKTGTKGLTKEELAGRGISVIKVPGSWGLEIMPDFFGEGGLLADWDKRKPGVNLVVVTVPGSVVYKSVLPEGLVPQSIASRLARIEVDPEDLKQQELQAASELVAYTRRGVDEALASGDPRSVARTTLFWAADVAQVDVIGQTPANLWQNNLLAANPDNSVEVSASEGKTVYVIVATGLAEETYSPVKESVVYFDPLGNAGFVKGDNSYMKPQNEIMELGGGDYKLDESGRPKFKTTADIITWSLAEVDAWAQNKTFDEMEWVNWAKDHQGKPLGFDFTTN